MIKRVELTRPEFLEWLANPSDDSHHWPRRQPSQAEISLVWLDEENDRLPLVAVDASGIRDFLAFTSTYVGSYTPFTAFFRVVARELISLLADRSYLLPAHFRNALIGMTIADAVYQLRPQERKLNEVTLQSCLATPSAVAFAGALIGYGTTLTAAAVDRWYSVRADLNPTATRPVEQPLKRFWSNVLSSIVRDGDGPDVDYRIPDFVRSVAEGSGVATLDGWRSLTLAMPELRGVDERLRGTREQRVNTLDDVLSDLRRSAISPSLQEMVLGYVTAQVAEGSFSYLSLAGRSGNTLPLAQLWFGFFAGLHENSDVMTAGDCLGRHIDRHFLDYRSGIPRLTSDVSYEEFLLVSDNTRARSLRTRYQGVVEVELLPGMVGRFRTTRNERSNNDDRSSYSIERVRKLVSELDILLRDMGRASSPPPADDLFGKEPSNNQSRQKRSTKARKGDGE